MITIKIYLCLYVIMRGVVLGRVSFVGQDADI